MAGARKSKVGRSKNILGRVRKYFPNVETVSDEIKDRALVHVTEIDCRRSKPGDFNDCALARAFRRELKVDGALIGLAYSYLIKGTHATRYRTPASVGRELVSFDRHQDFDQGTYHLAPVTPSQRIGLKKNEETGRQAKNPPKKMVRVHNTARVRIQP